MNILAENRFTMTKSLFYEGMLQVSKESYLESVKKAAVFLGALWFVLAAVTLLLQQNMMYVVVEFIILVVAALWLCAGVPRYNTKKAFKAFENKYGNDMERVTCFYEDRLEVEAAGRQTVVFYSEIKQMLHSKRLLLLIAEDKTGILVTHDGFTRGGEAAVCEAIENAQTDEDKSD